MRRPAPGVVCGVAAALLAVMLAALVPRSLPFAAFALAAFGLHVLLPLVIVLLVNRVPAPAWLRSGVAACGAGTFLFGASVWLPDLSKTLRVLVHSIHVGCGLLLLLGVVWVLTARERPGVRRRRLRGLAVGLAVLCGGVWGLHARPSTNEPSRYDAVACYRFLTATHAAQTSAAFFPSAIRVSSGGRTGSAQVSCQSSGCHPDAHTGTDFLAHTYTAESAAYRKTYAAFVRRRGEVAGNWCRGCHEPARLVDGRSPMSGSHASGIGCGNCHRAERVHALYGSAALVLGSGIAAPETPAEIRLRPVRHAIGSGQSGLLQSSALCGGCHRKHWNLPQNEFRWLPGQDEYGQWLISPYSGNDLYSGSEEVPPRSCISCHSNSHSTSRFSTPALALDLFVRRGPPDREIITPAEAADLHAGDPVVLDVVVDNVGIGHDFPTGMPDLQESWLEIRIYDRAGQLACRSGVVSGSEALLQSTHRYRLVGVTSAGTPVLHGNLDEMAAIREWRRVPSGDADLARYRFRVPEQGIRRIQVRMLRRRRPEFSRWVGESVPLYPEVLAEREVRWPSSEKIERNEARRWWRYGVALAGVRAYPHALRALREAEQLSPRHPETLLTVARVLLDDGDLLEALQAVLRARAEGGDRAQAWEGAIRRRMGETDRAIELLRPLTRRYPRSRRLRFELGWAYLAALRNREAEAQFRALLAVDPLDVRGHYGLMLCLQRLNELTAARREETLYELLRPTGALPVGSRSSGMPEGRRLDVYTLEPAP